MQGSEAVQTGSQKLVDGLAKKGIAVSGEDLRAALSIPGDAEFKLLRWYWKGQPPNPYEFYGSIEIQVENAGRVVQSILNSRANLSTVVIFPYGIPVVDRVIVNLSNEMPEIEG
ncbi:MAG: hypothetical protein ACRD3D_09510 [Terriglobia bacterium]